MPGEGHNEDHGDIHVHARPVNKKACLFINMQCIRQWHPFVSPVWLVQCDCAILCLKGQTTSYYS